MEVGILGNEMQQHCEYSHFPFDIKENLFSNPIGILQILFERQGYVINVRAHTTYF